MNINETEFEDIIFWLENAKLAHVNVDKVQSTFAEYYESIKKLSEHSYPKLKQKHVDEVNARKKKLETINKRLRELKQLQKHPNPEDDAKQRAKYDDEKFSLEVEKENLIIKRNSTNGDQQNYKKLEQSFSVLKNKTNQIFERLFNNINIISNKDDFDIRVHKYSQLNSDDVLSKYFNGDERFIIYKTVLIDEQLSKDTTSSALERLKEYRWFKKDNNMYKYVKQSQVMNLKISELIKELYEHYQAIEQLNSESQFDREKQDPLIPRVDIALSNKSKKNKFRTNGENEIYKVSDKFNFDQEVERVQKVFKTVKDIKEKLHTIEELFNEVIFADNKIQEYITKLD